MDLFLFFLFILISLFLIKKRIDKKKLKNLKCYFNNNWGKQKKNTSFNFHSIEKYFINNPHNHKAFEIISNSIELDFDINELFKFVDRTTSKIGQQYLYFKLRTIGSKKKLQEFGNLTSLFSKDNKLRLTCQLYLFELSSDDAYDLEELLNGRQLEKPKIIWLIYSLSFFSLIILFLGCLDPLFFIAILPVYSLNMFFHYKNKLNINTYLNGISQLSKGIAVAKNISKLNGIKEFYNNFDFLERITANKFKTIFVGFEKKIYDELTTIVWLLIEFFKILFNIEYIMFFSFLKSIYKERENIEKMFVFIGEIDSAISTASLQAGKLQNCTPKFIFENKLHVTEIIHPLVTDCISNNLELSNKSILLTGSNMSGKTTFIRSIGINMILAQTLNICFAKQYKAPFMKLYSSIRISDNVIENKSYYLEEVLRIKALIKASTTDVPCLFILDEIFKGTNTPERISIGKAILSFLNKGNNIVLACTHDTEITKDIVSEDYLLFHFNEKINILNKLQFDYKLKFGKLKHRNAINILELHNYPSEVINKARQNMNEIHQVVL